MRRREGGSEGGEENDIYLRRISAAPKMSLKMDELITVDMVGKESKTRGKDIAVHCWGRPLMKLHPSSGVGNKATRWFSIPPPLLFFIPFLLFLWNNITSDSILIIKQLVTTD